MNRPVPLLLLGFALLLFLAWRARAPRPEPDTAAAPITTTAHDAEETPRDARPGRPAPRVRVPDDGWPTGEVTVGREGYDVAGHVVDGAGRPRAFQALTVLTYAPGNGSVRYGRQYARHFSRPDILRGTYRLETDHSGAFAVRGLPPDLHADLVVAGDGLAHTRLADLQALAPQAAGNLEVVVPEGCAVQGTVNLDFWRQAEGVDIAGINGTRYEDRTELAVGGGYRLDQLPPGSYRVRLRFAPQFALAAGMDGWFRDTTLTEGELVELNFGYDRLYSLGGRIVVDSTLPEPGPVYLVPADAVSLAAVRREETDVTGGFQFDRLVPGAYDLVYPQRPAGIEVGWEVLQHHPGRVRLDLQADTSRVFNFPTYGDVTGTVDGGTVPEAVYLDGPRPVSLRAALSVPVRPDGAFGVTAVPPGTYDLVAENGIGRPVPDTQVLLRGVLVPEGGADVALTAKGQTRDSSLYVRMDGLQPDVPRLEMLTFWLLTTEERQHGEAWARRMLEPRDEQVFSGLPAGTFRLGVTADLVDRRLEIVPNPVDLRAGEESEVRIHILPTTQLLIFRDPTGKSWRALVLSDEQGGMRLAFNKVSAFSRIDYGYGNPSAEMTAEAARVRHLKPGSYFLELTAGEGGYQRIPVTLGMGETRLTVHP